MSVIKRPSLLADVPSSADVLVSGPPISGKTSLAIRYLAERAGGTVIVTTHRPPAKLCDTFVDNEGDTATFRVVDCSGTTDGGNNPAYVSVAKGPSDMTSAGVLTTDAIAEVEGAGAVGVGVCSLSDLLSYHDARAVSRFVDAIRGSLDETGFVVGVLNDRMHDETTVAALTNKFDVVIETRVDEDGSEMRVRDSGGFSEWQRL